MEEFDDNIGELTVLIIDTINSHKARKRMTPAEISGAIESVKMSILMGFVKKEVIRYGSNKSS